MAVVADITVSKRTETGTYFEEPLTDSISLKMVSIPGGSFQMGSPEDELDRRSSEDPVHEVTVPPFFMGMYAVTQAQWRAVAGWEKVNRDLDSNPSEFKGDDLPVEMVYWEETVEFCDRLSRRTGREYRLSSEAEWEYACRAGTTTPFHFGETITTDLANYQGTDNKELGWKGSYGDGPIGDYRQKTTPVGSFNVANAFGLYDMHGNVWEWCADHWHKNYEGAPGNGSAWLEGADASRRVVRGGSWGSGPWYCRSAYRGLNGFLGRRSSDIGFRVVCSTPRTL